MITLGIVLIMLAGFSDGSFYLPSKFTRNWEWEHYWSVFSIGFLVISWVLTLLLIPDIFTIYASVPDRELFRIIFFALLWGIGAILFGTALNKLGMALAYPITLGTVAVFGSLVPLLTTESDHLFTFKGAIVTVGLLITLIGIFVCSKAFKAKTAGMQSLDRKTVTLVTGLLIAVLAGVFSSLLNIGFSLAENMIGKAEEIGVSKMRSAVSPWGIFFSAAFMVNFGYSLFLKLKRKNIRALWNQDFKWNFSLGISMGEWKGAPIKARRLLVSGMVIIIISVATIAAGQFLNSHT